jgi:hypothetical protein
MWVQFVVPVQSDVEGVVVPYETVITTRVQSISSRGPITEGGYTLDPETTVSLDRFFPPVVDESEFIDAYLSKSYKETGLILTCGTSENSRNCYELKVQSVRFFEDLPVGVFAKLLE